MQSSTCNCSSHPVVKAHLGDALAASTTTIAPAHHAHGRLNQKPPETSGRVASARPNTARNFGLI
jgi:hypothetical protein